MHVYGCDNCLTVVRVYGDPDVTRKLIVEHDLWKDGLPCFQDGCASNLRRLTDGEAQAVVGHGLVQTLSLTVEEFFAALCGYGIPEEISPEPEVVQALLLSARVDKVAVSTSPTGRTLLSRMDLDNGTCLHLASSAFGPAIYKVTRRRHDTPSHDISSLRQVVGQKSLQCGDSGKHCSCGGSVGEVCKCRRGDGADNLGDTQISPGVSGGGCGDGERVRETLVFRAKNS